ncbi:MAG: hypothetical protein M0P43_09010 [Arcobacteraceae bacterium]|nr:hypothetical protein [Arcobacteraceae bacterium]
MIKSFLNKKHIISSVVATMLLSGCFGGTSEEKEVKNTKTITENVQDIKDSSKEIASQVVQNTKSQTSQIVEKVQDKASDVADNVKETTSKVVEKAKDTASDVATNVKETTVIVVEKTTEKIEEVLPSSTPAIDTTKLYSKCIACHGTNGEKIALGKSKIIKDMSQDDFIAALQGYQNGTYGGSMKGVMGGQVKGLSEDEIKALASHIIK